MSTYYSQIAFVCEDALALRAWYSRLFGFLPSGRTIYAGKLSTRVMGIENVNTRCYWSLDGNDSMFQLEFFDFRSPDKLPRPENWSPAMPGYNGLGIFCWQFQHCVDVLSAEGRLAKIEGERGQRIAYCKDPEGNALEVYERDPLPDAEWNRRNQPSAVRLIRLNSHDADSVERSWTSALGLVPRTMPEAFASRYSLASNDLSSPRYLQGGGLVMEICQTSVSFPGGVRPPLHQHGVMNFAINTGSRSEWDEVFARALHSGFRANGKALEAGIFKVMYVNDPTGNSIELLFPRRFAYPATGFRPSDVIASETTIIPARKETVWHVLARVVPQARSDYEYGGALLGDEKERKKQVTGIEEGRYVEYQITNRWLAPGHKTTIRLEQEEAGCQISWQTQLSIPIPIIRGLLNWLISSSVKRSLTRIRRISAACRAKSETA